MLSLIDTAPSEAPPPAFNMAQYILAEARQRPDQDALIVMGPDSETRWTYAQLEAAVRGVATGLLRHGLVPGDKVLMRLGNTVEFPIVYLAAIAVDLVPVPTSSQLTPLELDTIIAQVEPTLVVQDPALAAPKSDSSELLSDQLEAMHTLPPADYVIGDPERLAYIIFTSGTSGQPRAVCHAHRAIWARRMMFDGWYGLRTSDRMMHVGAFNWSYTLGTGLMDPWTLGATALIPTPGTPACELPRMAAKHRATILAAAPGVFRQMLKHKPWPALPALRHGLSAGERLPTITGEAWQARTGLLLHEAYGLSECSTFISACPDHPAPAGTSGWVQPGRRVALVGADGPVQRGTEGVIAIDRHDPGLMLGYLGHENETKQKFQDDWFLTGDTAVMAEDGALTYLGRADDMMNAGGFRVSPLEVEAAVGAFPGVQECAAIELRVSADTSIIAVVYVAASELDSDDLNTFASERLARYKMPRTYIHRDSLPKSANGKLNRKALRTQYEADHG